MEYLKLTGYDVCLLHDVFFKATDFQPYIADCRAKRTPVPYSADSLRHN